LSGANIPRAADYSKQFSKDWEKLSRSDMRQLQGSMLLLIANDPAGCLSSAQFGLAAALAVSG
jgi:hypothetical protein